MEVWYNANIDNPYPTPEVIAWLADSSSLSQDQVHLWFRNRMKFRSDKVQTKIPMISKDNDHFPQNTTTWTGVPSTNTDIIAKTLPATNSQAALHSTPAPTSQPTTSSDAVPIEPASMVLPSEIREAASAVKQQQTQCHNAHNMPGVSKMEVWYNANIENPYPTPDVIAWLAESSSLSQDQVQLWFRNRMKFSSNKVQGYNKYSAMLALARRNATEHVPADFRAHNGQATHPNYAPASQYTHDPYAYTAEDFSNYQYEHLFKTF